MLHNLYVKNLALIDEIEVEFKEGLNILTGETGAGKSIILGSINLALGGRYSSDILRNEEEPGYVELGFFMEDEAQIQLLKALDVYPEEGMVTLSRKMIGKRSVSKINGETVSISQLKEVAEILIDIHGQHEHQSLLYKKNHLIILDEFAKDTIKDVKMQVAEAFQTYKKYKEELQEANLDEKERNKELSFLAFEINEIQEANYEKEKQLMKAVSQGNLHLVTAVASSVYNNGTEQRLPDSLRDRKNYLIILKTLLRKAAEHGNVHPLHIHQLTSKYAKRIEETRSLKESLQLQENMIRDYCILVNKHSLSQYSYYVGKAITIINYDLTADLSLHSISSQLNVNSSYLSNLFHKECNCTLTEYVNRKRITHAVSMLKNTDKLIQDIASDCGFQDTTYFIRLFKKQFGCTPLQYRGSCV